MSIAFPLLIFTMLSVSLVRTIGSRERRMAYAEVVRAWRPWMLLAAPLKLALVVLTASLIGVALPVLRWSWWLSVAGDHAGTPLIGTPVAAWVSWFPYLAGALLLVLLPMLALGEEEMFRRTDLRPPWSLLAAKGLWFGLVHAFVGVPLYICLTIALISAPIYSAVYLRRARREYARLGDCDHERCCCHYEQAQDEGVLAAAAFHATCNYFAVGIAILGFYMGWIG